jgi:environmental stress-induced protein Ves
MRKRRSASLRGRRPMKDPAAVQIIRKSSLVPTPWKNGGGITHEAIRVPASGEPFLWRVSIAHIAKPGPFSDFAGYQRTMVLLQGDGMALHFANGDRKLLRETGALAQFDGALAANCELLGGPCMDLNLMVAKSLGEVSARVQRLHAPLRLRASGRETVLLACVQGTLVLEGDGAQAAALEPGDLAVLAPAPGGDRCLLKPADSSAAALAFIAGIRT